MGRSAVARLNESYEGSLGPYKYLFCQRSRISVQNSGHGEVDDAFEDAQHSAEDLDLVRVDEVASELREVGYFDIVNKMQFALGLTVLS